jgi:nifR3 family TIM-barrel protein
MPKKRERGNRMRLGNIEIEKPLLLGPMAGVTDWAFRTVCATLGADITVTEMVSSRALVYKDKKSAALLQKNAGSICGAQIFGNDPAIMAEAARLALEISGCDFLDINMGCPMPKIANSGDGCGLMRTPELAGEIVKAVKKAVTVPVTVKCRLGWDKGSINVLDFTARMEDCGADMLTVHGRTRSMLYTGKADWDMIAKVKAARSVPVIANGDVVDGESALRCLKWTGADGLMIGRATFGDPWIFAEVKAAMNGDMDYMRPQLSERVAVAVEQFRLAKEEKGEHIACLEARKHFAWYLRGVSHSSFYKAQISSISTMEDVERIAKDICRDLR